MNRWILFLISVLVLGAAWWTSEFPMLAFVALAPAIALFMPAPSQSSENGEDLSDPGHAERILLLFGIVFIGSSFLTKGGHFEAAVWSIAYTLPFLVLAWVRHNLGSRAGVVPLILAWMTMEYLMVKVQWPASPWYLADLLIKKPKWSAWVAQQGYLAVSVWLITTSLLAWAAFFRGTISVVYVVLFLLAVGLPIGMSYWSEQVTDVISRETMLKHYSGGIVPGSYASRGEWMARTTCWVTILMILFAAVKGKTSQKAKKK